MSVLVPLQSPTLWTIIQPFFGWAFLSSLILIGLCLFIVGNLLWLAEHRHNSEQFPKNYVKGVIEGVWCALTTFSTVGYGDRYPVTNFGRLIAGSWMLISLAAVTTLTAGIATTLTLAFSAQPYQKLQSPSDLKGVRLVTISGSKAVEWGQYYQARIVKVDSLSEGIRQLESNQVDGVLYSRLVLEYYLYQNPQAPYRVVDFDIGTQNYSIALTQDHPLTEKLNEEIVSIEMRLRFQEVKETWFKSQVHK
ncbi:MAG: transporter substrate-binding domain-containing protein [Crocosphaera sp.]